MARDKLITIRIEGEKRDAFNQLAKSQNTDTADGSASCPSLPTPHPPTPLWLGCMENNKQFSFELEPTLI